MTRHQPPHVVAQLTDVAERLLTSPSRLEILQLLQHHGAMTASELAEYAGTTRNAINRHVTGLVADGWITIAGTTEGRRRPHRTLELSEDHDWTALIEEVNRRAPDKPS